MGNYSTYRTVRITDVADIERAKKGKVYPADCIMIGLSATKGQVEYVSYDREIPTKWAVVIPNGKTIPKYLFYSVQHAFPAFVHSHLTGINLQFEELQYLTVKLHPLEVQQRIVHDFELIEAMEERERKEVEYLKKTKKSYLGRLFPNAHL